MLTEYIHLCVIEFTVGNISVKSFTKLEAKYFFVEMLIKNLTGNIPIGRAGC